MKVYAAFTIALFTIGCSSSHNIEISNISEITVTYLDKHKEVSTIAFGEDSKELALFKDWLKINQSGWEIYLVTVAPGNMIISGDKFSLNVGDTSAILNFDRGAGKYTQYSKSISLLEFGYFLGDRNTKSKQYYELPQLRL